MLVYVLYIFKLRTVLDGDQFSKRVNQKTPIDLRTELTCFSDYRIIMFAVYSYSKHKSTSEYSFSLSLIHQSLRLWIMERLWDTKNMSLSFDTF